MVTYVFPNRRKLEEISQQLRNARLCVCERRGVHWRWSGRVNSAEVRIVYNRGGALITGVSVRRVRRHGGAEATWAARGRLGAARGYLRIREGARRKQRCTGAPRVQRSGGPRHAARPAPARTPRPTSARTHPHMHCFVSTPPRNHTLPSTLSSGG